jgi:hypothetical protein
MIRRGNSTDRLNGNNRKQKKINQVKYRAFGESVMRFAARLRELY